MYSQDDLTELLCDLKVQTDPFLTNLMGLEIQTYDSDYEMFEILKQEWAQASFWRVNEVCIDCDGSGHSYNGEDVLTCLYCQGNGFVRARDSKGRFQ